jgi:hypothetical protein
VQLTGGSPYVIPAPGLPQKCAALREGTVSSINSLLCYARNDKALGS